MRIYQYDPDVNNYDGIKANGKGDKVLATITGTPLVEKWSAVPVQVDAETGEMGDFPSPAGHFFPVFSERAWALLAPQIGQCVEALPLQCKVGVFFAINVLKVEDCLDMDRSQFDRLSNGKIYAIDKYVFKSGIELHSPIFRVLQDLSEIHVTDVFRELVRKNKLKGLLWHSLGTVS